MKSKRDGINPAVKPSGTGCVCSGRMWFHLRRCAECGHIGSAADRSLVALLGASPGAPTAAFIAIGVLEKCFPNELTANG